jgi:hypothetical protein
MSCQISVLTKELAGLCHFSITFTGFLEKHFCGNLCSSVFLHNSFDIWPIKFGMNFVINLVMKLEIVFKPKTSHSRILSGEAGIKLSMPLV